MRTAIALVVLLSAAVGLQIARERIEDADLRARFQWLSRKIG